VDDLTAMMLADGEQFPAAASHAAACTFCAGRIAALRAEAAILAGALALDGEELAFLREAQVPARVEAWAAVPFGRPLAKRWETPGLLLATLAVVAAGATGWQIATSMLAAGAEVAGGAGGTALLAALVAGWALDLVRLLWQGAITVSALPVVESPTLPLLVMAAILWIALAIAPRLAPTRTASAATV
jgi:hypothetical protein